MRPLPPAVKRALDAARRHPRLRAIVLVLLGATLAKVLLGGAVATLLGFAMEPVPVSAEATDAPADASSTPVKGTDASTEREVRRLENILAAYAPRKAWIVIDRANNRLWVRTRRGVVLDAVVSTGSGAILRERGDQSHEGRSWTFDTPSGRFRVLSERHNPVWVKPDWAFLEEGQQPPPTLAERRDPGSLGAWALDLGDGYMIHGTLYERLLGRSTTHGCVRVGSDDLARLVTLADPGTFVFIF
jgi:L,D-transpeptidase ErfK/SrfK